MNKKETTNEKPKVMLATDCGSTTTKAILVVLTDEGYRLAGRGEAPTTVEAPFDDVTVGVRNAVEELEDITGRKILDENRNLICPRRGAIFFILKFYNIEFQLLFFD